jgi:hypothetical protein
VSNTIDDLADLRRRSDADRPSPAVPLLLLGVVVAGALVVALIRAAQSRAAAEGFRGSIVILEQVTWTDPVRLSWWVFASLAAYLSAIWIARRQGYRRGVWVDRLPLALGGLGALLVALIAQFGWRAAGILGDVPLLAIAAGIVVWAVRERRFGLWLLTVVFVPLTLLTNLYNMENVLFRLGVPYFANADEIVGLGAVALALFAAAAIFAVGRRRQLRAVEVRSAQ